MSRPCLGEAPRYGHLNAPLSPPVEWALAAAGAERLYTHQAEAINAALAGQHVVVATSTASGKTLCYNVPVLEALARDPLARAPLHLPDQGARAGPVRQVERARRRRRARRSSTRWPPPTTATRRRARASRIRKTARVLLTNPDMLHAGILPNHPLWAEFFRHLRYVVIDEAHTYRGVFGSQVACVLRRLRRVCALYQGRASDQRTRSAPDDGDRMPWPVALRNRPRRRPSSPPPPRSPTRRSILSLLTGLHAPR